MCIFVFCLAEVTVQLTEKSVFSIHAMDSEHCVCSRTAFLRADGWGSGCSSFSYDLYELYPYSYQMVRPNPIPHRSYNTALKLLSLRLCHNRMKPHLFLMSQFPNPNPLNLIKSRLNTPYPSHFKANALVILGECRLRVERPAT